MTAIIDNNYINGPLVQAFEANKILAKDLREVGFELQPKKLKCHLDAVHRNSEWDCLRGDIPNGVLKNGEGRGSADQWHSTVRNDGL